MDKLKENIFGSPEDEGEATAFDDAKKNAAFETDIFLDYASVLEDIRNLEEGLNHLDGHVPSLEHLETVLETIRAKENKQNMKSFSVEDVQGDALGDYKPLDNSLDARRKRVSRQATEELASLKSLKERAELVIYPNQAMRHREKFDNKELQD